jgi:hypothetical protein
MEAITRHGDCSVSRLEREEIETIRKKKNALGDIYVKYMVPANYYGKTRECLESMLARKVFARFPDQYKNLLDVSEWAFSEKGPCPLPRFSGETVFKLGAYDSSSLAAALLELGLEPLDAAQVKESKCLEFELVLEFELGEGSTVKALESAVNRYLAKESLPCVFRREEGDSLWDIPEKARKRKVTRGIRLTKAEGKARLCVQAQKNFNYAALEEELRKGASVLAPISVESRALKLLP